MFKRGSSRDRRGSSVVELIVALGILAIGAAGAFQHYQNSMRNGARFVEEAQTRLMAHQQLEQLLAVPYAKLSAWTPPNVGTPIETDYYAQFQVKPQPAAAGGAAPLAVTVTLWRSEPGNASAPANATVVTGVKLP